MCLISLTPVYTYIPVQYVCGCSYVCINSAELGAMYYIGGPKLPLIQAAELGLCSTQADGMAIITRIYKMKFQSNSNYESGFDLVCLSHHHLALQHSIFAYALESLH